MEVVLVNPLIPQNTGSIARTCAATETSLHLVGKLGFEITEKAVRRAGLDYWPFVKLSQHPTWETYKAASQAKRFWMVETTGKVNYCDVSFGPNDALVFGAETVGIPAEIMGTVPQEHIIRIPIFCEGVRSLNLSNAVAVVLFEALKQTGAFSSR